MRELSTSERQKVVAAMNNLVLIPPVAPSQPATLADELASVDLALTEVTGTCADALTKAARHYRGDEAWVIGTMPDCGIAIDAAEARVKRLLANSHLATPQAAAISVQLKTLSDLRAVNRAARQVVQIAWLLRQSGLHELTFPLVQATADAACLIACETAEALCQKDHPAARGVALKYRQVEEARNDGEQLLRINRELLPATRRLTRSALWFFAVGGECFARIAVRFAAHP